MLALAARLLEAGVPDLVMEDGRVSVRGFSSRSVTFRQLAKAAQPGAALPAGMTPGLDATDYFHVTECTYPYGMDAALVEVDPETGLVRILKYVIAADVGRALNPLIVDGQTVGGMAQGVGAALLEELVYDADGQLLTTSFMDYLVPTAADMPETVVLRLQGGHPSRHNPLGAKGAGEGGILAAPAALANAVEDALRPLGVTVDRLPLSPDRVLALVRDARGSCAL